MERRRSREALFGLRDDPAVARARSCGFGDGILSRTAPFASQPTIHAACPGQPDDPFPAATGPSPLSNAGALSNKRFEFPGYSPCFRPNKLGRLSFWGFTLSKAYRRR